MILVFSGEESGKVFLWSFFTHPKEILRPADLNLILSGQTLWFLFQAVLIYIYRNTVLLMIMGQNWGYESGFYVIISNQPYWNYHGFCLSGGPCKVFQCPGGQRKLLHCCLLVGISTQADTELFVTWQERQRKFLCIIKFFYLYIF